MEAVGSVESVPAEERPGLKARFKTLVKEYGKLAIVLHLGIFWITWLSFAAAIALGWEVEGATGGAGIMLAAYLPTQVTKPPRVVLTCVLTPVVAKKLRALRSRREAERDT